MITYSQLMPYITPELPGVHTGVLLNAIREAAREFCADTGIWVQDLAATDVVAGTQSYELSALLPTKSEIHAINWVKINGGVQNPYNFSLDQASTLKFGDEYIPTVSTTGGLKVSVMLIPTLVDDALPSYILTRWYKAVIAWACVSLMSDPLKPYGNDRRLSRWIEEKMHQDSCAKRSFLHEHVLRDFSAASTNWIISNWII